MNDKLKKAFRIVGYTLGGLLMIFMLLIFSLRFTAVQRQLVPSIERILTKTLDAQVSVGGLFLEFPMRASLDNLILYDQQQEKLAEIGAVKISLMSVPVWRLLFGSRQKQQKIGISRIDIHQPKVFLYKQRRDSVLNLKFLLETGEKDTSQTPRNIKLEFPRINLIEGTFTYVDSTKSDSLLNKFDKLNFGNIQAEDLNAQLSVHIDGHQNLKAELHHLEARERHSGIKLDTLKTEFWAWSGVYHAEMDTNRPFIMARNLVLASGKTHLDLDALLYDEDFQHLTDTTFDESVYLKFHPSSLDFNAIDYFVPGGIPLEGVIGFKGALTGSLNKLSSEEMNITYLDTTELNATVTLTDYIKPSDLYMDIDLHDNSHVNFSELKKLLPTVDIPLFGTVNVDGRVRGNLEYLKSKKLKVRYGKETELELDLRLHDYTKVENLLLDVRFTNSRVNIEEIHRMLPEIEIPSALYKFGQLKLDGDFTGGLEDFVVRADFNSQFGNLSTDLHLILPPRVGKLTYTGRLTTENLNYSEVALDDVFKSERLNFTGTVKGSGTSFFDMDATVDGLIVNSDLFGYDIDTLQAKDFVIKDSTLNGKILLSDRKGHVDASVQVDMGGDKHIYDLAGDIEDLDLTYFGLSPDSTPLLFSSIVNVHVDGDSLENFEGNAKLYQLKFLRPHNQETLAIRRVVIDSKENTATSKNIALKSTFADGELSSNLSFRKGIGLFKRLAYEGELYFRNVDSLIYAYYDNKIPDSTDAIIDVALRPEKQLNEVLKFLAVPLWVSDSTYLDGHFVFGEFEQVELTVYSDSLSYNAMEFKENSFSANITKDGSRNDVLIGSGDLKITDVKIDKALSFQEVRFEPILNNNEVEYWVTGKQIDYDNFFRFNATTEFFGNGVFTKVNPSISRINLHGKQWVIDQNNEIFIDGSTVQIDNLQLYNGNQRISVDGEVGKDPEKSLDITIDSLDFRTITDVYHLPLELDGVIDSVGIKLYNLYDQPKAFLKGNLANFGYGKVDSLDITLNGFWQDTRTSNLATLNAYVHYKKERVLSLRGRYDFLDSISPIHVNSKASNLPLYFVEPFVDEFVNIPSGTVRIDTFHVKGSIKDLDVQGTGHFENTEFHVKYLNNNFRLSNDTRIVFDRDKIIFPRITILDTAGNPALLDGTIRHNGLKTFQFDLQVSEIRNFVFMNTSKKDNDLFYGTVVVKNGLASITGTDKKIGITADVEVGKGSVLSIPLDDYETADRPEYVQFIGKNGKVEAKDKLNLSGFELDLNVIATPVAKARLIFDEKVGDVIEATGNGNISLKITNEGDFSMYGSYEILKGEYLFTTYNVYNKKFLVKQGGQINWSGDPYEAILDLEAFHTVKANLSDLFGSENTSKVPVTIIMKMTGPLSKPVIDLALQVSTDSEGASAIMDYLSNIQNDEQELNRQVVSLLIFKRFAPSHSSMAGGGFVSSGLTSTVSELISNQVNNWLSQAFDDQFGVELSSTSGQEIDLALRANLFGDKVTIERNGTLIGNRNGQVSIGDISVLIKLLPQQYSKTDSNYVADPSKGQLVVEIFNRESASMTSVRNSYTTGGGLFYKKDFDRLSELLRRKDEKLHPKIKE